jgi:hypothetical protein
VNPRKLSRRGLAAAGLATLGVVAASGVAYAYWTASAPNVPVHAAADSVNAGSTPTVSVDGTTVTLGWTAVTTQGGRQVTGYLLKRYDAPSGGAAVAAAQGTCAATVGALSCAETGVPDGTWYYTTTPVLGAWLGAESARSAPVTVVSDAVVPTVTSIVRAGASPNNGATVSWTVTFSEPVTGVDVTDFVLAATGVPGAAISSVTPVDPSTYTVTAGTGGGSGEGTLSLNLVDDDSIADLAGNSLGGPGVNGSAGGGTYVIDRQAPAVAGITRAGSSPTNAGSVAWNVVFTEDVSGVNAADFSLAKTGTVATGALTVTPTSDSSYKVTAGSVTGDGDLTLSLVDDDSIADLAGNALGGAGTGNGNLTGQTYAVDRTTPTVVSINRSAPSPTNGSSLVWRVTFSEGVTGVNASDFAMAATGSASGATPVVTAVGANRYDVSVGSVAGTGTLGLNLVDDDSIADATGNSLGGTGTGNGNFAGQTYAVDRTAPTVLSVVRAAASPTKASSVSWTVTFSESVTGIDTSDFGVTLGGGVSGSVTSVSAAAGTAVTVTATGVSGNGTIGLDVKDDDSIKDGIGNALGGAGANNGAVTDQAAYISDRIAPVAAGVSSANKAEGTQGRMEAGDSITFVFGEANGMNPGSIASGWSGSSALNVVIRAVDGGSGSNDFIAVYDATDTTALNLGSVDLGAKTYLTGSTTFGTSITPSTLTYAPNGTFVLTFGAPSAPGVATEANPNRLTWTPSSAAADAAGNASSTAPKQSGNEKQF